MVLDAEQRIPISKRHAYEVIEGRYLAMKQHSIVCKLPAVENRSDPEAVID
jgi:hypothetical protein